jgi:hypothetical protein
MSDTISIADLRMGLGDVLSRAHYQDEVIMIAKRDKPFAVVASDADGESLSDVKRYAKERQTDVKNVVPRLRRYENVLDRFAKQSNIPLEVFVERLESALSDAKKSKALQDVVKQ